jgi:NADP-dependent 3-hydroxy acid dehydrogenase YdfG
MFIRTETGTLVNINMVGEFYVCKIAYPPETPYGVIAHTGGGANSDNPILDTIVYRGSKENCQEYMTSLYQRLSASGLMLKEMYE